MVDVGNFHLRIEPLVGHHMECKQTHQAPVFGGEEHYNPRLQLQQCRDVGHSCTKEYMWSTSCYPAVGAKH